MPDHVGPAAGLEPPHLSVAIQLAISSLLLGGVYALVSVGLTLIFGVMRLVNFAHGEFVMLGMYLAFWAFTRYHVTPYLALPSSVILFFGLGLAVYALVMRGVIDRSHTVQIFTTLGLSTALQNLALVMWSGDFRFVRIPAADMILRIGGAAFNLAQVIAFALALAFTGLIFAALRWTHLGKVVQATAQDRDAATLLGIDADRVYALTFAIGITCVGVAGVLVAPLYPVYPTAGFQFVLIAFVVIVLGGLGDLLGALLGSFIVAGIEVAGGYMLGVAWKEVLYFVIFILLLIFRPTGLFGQRGAEMLGA